MENSVKVEVFRPNSDSKVISHAYSSSSLKSLIAAVYAVKSETNAYLTELVENEKTATGKIFSFYLGIYYIYRFLL